CMSAGSADKEHKSIADLAREGYLFKEEKSAFDAAMGMIGKPAPELPITDWRGKPQDLAKLKGKIAVVDFWGTFCLPCITQIPHMNEIARKYADKGVVVFGACEPEGAARMNTVAEKHGMEYPTGKVTDATNEKWNVVFWPTYAIVDRNGMVRAIGVKDEYVN